MIPQFNAYSPSGAKPFYMNNVVPLDQPKESNLMDNIASEWYWQYGSDINFLPRNVNKEETTFGEYLSATFEKGFPVRMFIEEVEAWSGNGDMYSKFGLQVTDECTLYINKTSFNNATSGVFPKQGDLMYVHKSQKLFEISHVEDEVQPAFYLLGNRMGYKIQCKLFMYNHQTFNQAPSAGIPDAVKALDDLLEDLAGNQVELPVKDYNQNNVPIQQTATPIINNSEDDPLLG